MRRTGRRGKAAPSVLVVEAGRAGDRARQNGASRSLRSGGAYRDRTDDPLLAKQVLSQLS